MQNLDRAARGWVDARLQRAGKWVVHTEESPQAPWGRRFWKNVYESHGSSRRLRWGQTCNRSRGSSGAAGERTDDSQRLEGAHSLRDTCTGAPNEPGRRPPDRDKRRSSLVQRVTPGDRPHSGAPTPGRAQKAAFSHVRSGSPKLWREKSVSALFPSICKPPGVPCSQVTLLLGPVPAAGAY